MTLIESILNKVHFSNIISTLHSYRPQYFQYIIEHVDGYAIPSI
jgi:hypothetical protein